MTLIVMGWPNCEGDWLCRAAYPKCKDPTCAAITECITDYAVKITIQTITGSCWNDLFAEGDSNWMMEVSPGVWEIDTGFGLPGTPWLGLGTFRLTCVDNEYTMEALHCPSAGHGGPGQIGVLVSSSDNPFSRCFKFTFDGADIDCPGCYDEMDPRPGTLTLCITQEPNTAGPLRVSCDPECCCGWCCPCGCTSVSRPLTELGECYAYDFCVDFINHDCDLDPDVRVVPATGPNCLEWDETEDFDDEHCPGIIIWIRCNEDETHTGWEAYEIMLKDGPMADPLICWLDQKDTWVRPTSGSCDPFELLFTGFSISSVEPEGEGCLCECASFDIRIRMCKDIA